MPTKRRLTKRRTEIPAADWEMVFLCGWDLLGDLREYGITGDEQARDAAKGAWAVLGPSYMATWKPDAHRPLPWAAVAFGLPEGFSGSGRVSRRFGAAAGRPCAPIAQR